MAGTPLHVARGEGGVPAPFDWVRVRRSPHSLAVARQAVDLRIPGVNPMFHALCPYVPQARGSLRRQLERLKHPAITIWHTGNESNPNLDPLTRTLTLTPTLTLTRTRNIGNELNLPSEVSLALTLTLITTSTLTLTPTQP